MWELAQLRDHLEEELNEGGWTQDSEETDIRSSLFRATGNSQTSLGNIHVLIRSFYFTTRIHYTSTSVKYRKRTFFVILGISAAVCISTMVLQRRMGQSPTETSYEELDPYTSYDALRPHPVRFDATDDSDIESVRTMPISHQDDFDNRLNTSPESARSVRRLRLVDVSVQSEKPLMLDRGTSPLPSECFDSEVDSEERLGLASGLWHFKPTALPEASLEEEDVEEAIQSSQKQWLKEFSHETEHTKEDNTVDIKKFKQNDKGEEKKLVKASSVGESRWRSVVKYLLETPSSDSKKDSASMKSRYKLEDLYIPDW
eukprot:g3317.t1